MISPTLVSDLRSTSKPSEKQAILLENDNEFLRYILKSAYEPFENYHIKIKAKEIPEPGEFDITDPLTRETFVNVIEFCRQSNSNKQNRERVLPVLERMTKDTQDLLIGVLHKNFKCGISVKLINKTFPGLITQFNVQLSNTYTKAKQKKSFKPKKRLCSYKLDGIRCVALKLDGVWKGLSRQGKEFLTIDHIKEELDKTGFTFFDGELYIDGAPFEVIQSCVTSFTKGTNTDIVYRPFIVGDVEKFLSNEYVPESFYLAHEVLDSGKLSYINPLEQWLVEDADIEKELEKAFDLGYEGIMLRDPDFLYDFKRSDALLKLKESTSKNSQEQTADCLVVDYLIDSYPVIINETLVYKQLLTKLVVQQKDGSLCKVGSGFTLDFRYKYTETPEEILGKVVEIKFQGYGSKGLMRFPRLFRVREDIDWDE